MIVSVYPEYMKAVYIKWSLWLHVEQWIYTQILNNCFFSTYYILGRGKMPYRLLQESWIKLVAWASPHFLVLGLAALVFFSCVLTAFCTNWSTFPFPALKETCCTQVNRKKLSGLLMRWHTYFLSFFSVFVFFHSYLQLSVTRLGAVSCTAGQQPQREVLICKMFKTVNVFLLSRACSSWLSALDSFCLSTHSFGFLNFI